MNNELLIIKANFILNLRAIRVSFAILPVSELNEMNCIQANSSLG